MMKRYVVGAALVAGFAGAVGVSASTVNLRGSDTLFEFTTAMIANCPGAVGPYAGGGSGTGQSAMIGAAPTQQIAPMSRFLNNGVCTAVGSLPAQSNGLVIGLDGVSIVGSKKTFAAASVAGSPTLCANGDSNVTCDPNFQTTTGLAFDATVSDPSLPGGTYTFNGWRDVLRVLFAGFDHSNNGTGAANLAARDCASPVRTYLANHYGSIFENSGCTAQSGDTLGTCTQIRHIFRRDDFSGTTDTIVGLLNLPGIVLPETTVTVNTTGTASSVVQHTGSDPFCNSVRPSFAFPLNAAATPPVLQPACLQGADATWDPTDLDVIAACAGQVGVARETSVLRSTMQDNDPIRRTCARTGLAIGENVCSHSGNLGLLLPMNDVPEASPRTNADRYNATPCTAGRFTSVPPPQVYDAVTQAIQVCARNVLCPNGDRCTATGACLVPANTTTGAQCMADVTNRPPTPVSTVPVPRINPVIPSGDGREYNQHLYLTSGASAVYQTGTFNATPTVAVTGAYYRIHTTRSMDPAVAPAVPVTCQFPDMTDQIGCLVQASPCSIGFAGRGTLDTNPNTGAIKVNKQSPETACIQNNFTYPLSRKLYLSSVPGFANVTAADEVALAGCETDLAQAGTPAGLVTTNPTTDLAQFGFINIAPTYNGGKPFCEDFNENMLCAAAANVNSCPTASPLANGLNFPTANATVCGNGIKEQYEDCDCGTTLTGSGAAPCAGTFNGGAVCSTTCRLNN